MHSFKDNAGRTWSVAINVTVAKRVRDTLKVDVLRLSGDAERPEEHLFTKLHTDPIFLVDLLFVICQTEAESNGVTDVQFGEAMAGDCIDLAAKALLEELVDFCPNPRDRKRAQRVLRKANEMIEKAGDLLDAKVSDETLEAEMQKALDGM